MKDFLNDKYQKQGEKNFLTVASLLCFLSDIANIAYINLYWLHKHLSQQMIATALTTQGVSMNSISSHDFKAYKELLIDSMGLVFVIFAVYHCFVYFKMARNKLWAKKYVYGYGLTGALLTLIELPITIQEHILWSVVMLLTTLVYIYTCLGIRFFKKQAQ